MFKHQIGFITMVLILVILGCTPSQENNVPPIKPSFTPTATSMSEPDPPSTPTALPEITEKAQPTRLNIAYGNLPTALDPHRTSDAFAEEVLRFICQGLTDLDDRPLLATQWAYAPDNTSITLTLRKGVVFRDGTPFDAEAVRYSFERLQQPASNVSPVYEAFQNIQIETPDAYTVIISFDEPRPDFTDVLNTGYAAIISPSSDETKIAKDPICTGPYSVKEWEPGQFILLAKNEDFSAAPDYLENKGPAYIDEIKIHLIETQEERFRALLEGTLDMNHIDTKEELSLIKERSEDFETRTGFWLGGITYLGFNYAHSPTDELELRQALAQAIDKRELINLVLAEEFAMPAVSLLSPRSFGYTDALEDVEYKFDQSQSRQILAGAGFVDNDGDGILERDGQELRLKLLTTTDNIYLDMATKIKERLAEIGVAVDIQQATRQEIGEITPACEFDLLLYDYNWPYPSALDLFLSSERIGRTNRVCYSNPEVDKLLAEISALAENPANDDIRLEKITDAQRLIIQDVPWQPILVRRVVSAVNKRVVGEKVHDSGILIWHDAKIVEQ